MHMTVMTEKKEAGEAFSANRARMELGFVF